MNRSRNSSSLILPIQTLIAASIMMSASAMAGELTISINNLEGSAGQVMVAVLDSESAFKGETPAVLSLLMPPRPGTLTFSTDALADGHYGVRVMVDENGNGDMDSNMVGMPTEAWGFSNNAVGSFGPPSWSDIRFELKGNTPIAIDLNH